LADSAITKKALAMALKELMKEQSFASISVKNISERCNMNRKSFYYHFKDKYDLVNWIFDTEFILTVRNGEELSGWEIVTKLAEYLYQNHEFYRAAMRIKGQNSFRDHFQEVVATMIEHEMERLFAESEINEFQLLFLTDGFTCAFSRWIIQKDCIAAEEFIHNTKDLIGKLAAQAYKSLEDNKK